MDNSAAVARIPINGNVLKWARLRVDESVEDAARRVSVDPDRLRRWEDGRDTPTVRQARTLANIYDRPFLEFFGDTLPNVPNTQLAPDFRFHRDASSRDNAGLKSIQRWAEETRLNAIDLLEIIGEETPRLPQDFFSDLSSNAESAGEAARRLIGPTLSIQFSRKSRGDNFADVIRASFEQAGILVLRRSDLRKLNARGMCLFADPLPVIVFGVEAAGAQAFTLAHELGHVAIRYSAISGAPRFGGRTGGKRVEAWCNTFAAAYLMPRHAILADVGLPQVPHDSIEDSQIEMLAKRYAVSRHALLIRLVALGIVKPAFYWFTKRPEFLVEESAYKPPPARPRYYGSRYRTSRGDFYTGLVIEAWNRGQITNHNAAEFMGIRNIAHLNNIRADFGG